MPLKIFHSRGMTDFKNLTVSRVSCDKRTKVMSLQSASVGAEDYIYENKKFFPHPSPMEVAPLFSCPHIFFFPTADISRLVTLGILGG